jgi:ABC-type uncharacterized transport system ATPase component
MPVKINSLVYRVLIYCHPLHTATKCGERTVTLRRGLTVQKVSCKCGAEGTTEEEEEAVLAINPCPANVENIVSF